MKFSTLDDVVAALRADDEKPSRCRYLLHRLAEETWLAFSPEPASSSHWVQIAPGAQSGKPLSLNRALHRILLDVRENWVGDELDIDEADSLVQQYRLVKLEPTP